MKLTNYEFHVGTPTGDVIIHNLETGVIKMYEQGDLEFTRLMLEKIQKERIEAYKALCDIYDNVKLHTTYYEFLIVRRFVKCNFFLYDNMPDIDTKGVFNLEYVPCPLRGECKYCDIICNAKFSSALTRMESVVMKMYYEGGSMEDISEKLHISILTVKTHKRNAYEKLKISSFQEFYKYARENQLFK